MNSALVPNTMEDKGELGERIHRKKKKHKQFTLIYLMITNTKQNLMTNCTSTSEVNIVLQHIR